MIWYHAKLFFLKQMGYNMRKERIRGRKLAMPFQIIHNDITNMNTDAIVNAANSHLQEGGGVCGAIFRKAGEELLQKECDLIGTCPVGHAVITKGYHLPAKYVIHAVGPVWNGGKQGEAQLLSMAYRNSLELAGKYELNSISFPLISSGIYGYPKDAALQIAISAIREFLLHQEMEIYLVVFDRKAIQLSARDYEKIHHYVKTFYDDSDAYNSNVFDQVVEESVHNVQQASRIYEKERYFESTIDSLDDIVKQMDETFSEMILRLIAATGKTDTQVYKKANIDRKLFSKIRIHKDYQPKKRTALALAVALELSLDETKNLLMKAGYTFSLSNRFDVIVRYFIENRNYDMFLINQALFVYDQPLLGA
jgi:O-acetyl-ADP-ribose deacetylase (regulator of RNase III)